MSDVPPAVPRRYHLRRKVDQVWWNHVHLIPITFRIWRSRLSFSLSLHRHYIPQTLPRNVSTMYLLPFLLSPLTVFAQQHFTHKTYDAGLFTPLESLPPLSEDTFTTLGHPFFPNYNVRVKKSRFCDTTVNVYTGYINIQARHLFFYFFESRNDPAMDDVIFWTNGGPGCSSSIGLFMELGPCRVLNTTELTFHPESWNTNANVFSLISLWVLGFRMLRGSLLVPWKRRRKILLRSLLFSLRILGSLREGLFIWLSLPGQCMIRM
ncbi:serine carboxypeptidase-domain-containing protein [Cyathus striatus]|nr:serine carboxypeptidase-domain-containing protein [Cyathus striatus]